LSASKAFGLEVVDELEIRKPEDVAPGRKRLRTVRARINTLASGARLPTLYPNREYLQAGGLMSYGPSFSDLFLRAADYVDKILRGAKPGSLPIEQPTKFELIINLVTAKALGLTVSQMLIARADEVIE
jgi:putative ABC transport system substrate-binding protein